MTPLQRAERIIVLHKSIASLDDRLKEIDRARNFGKSIRITFKLQNPTSGWGDVDGLVYERGTLTAGNLGDIAAIVLARMSDEVARKKRDAEFELRALEKQS